MLKRHVVEGQPQIVRKEKSGRDVLDKAYADAMQKVYERFYGPDSDPDVASLNAEAHMQLSPWKLWPYVVGVNDAEHYKHNEDVPKLTQHILGILQRAFDEKPANKHHTGLVHFWWDYLCVM